MEIGEPCWILVGLLLVVKGAPDLVQLILELEVEAAVVSVDCQTAAQIALGQEQTPPQLLNPALLQEG